MTEEKKVEDPKKKGIFTKIKESIDDKEEQLDALSTMVRLGILIWSGGILTLAYIKLPPAFGIPEQKLDPTFIASVFTGALSTFGLATTKDKSKSNGVSKEDMEAMIAKSNTAQTEQIIRVQTPLTINGAQVVKTDPITGKDIDPITGKLT